jgi:hypothetical protein
VFVGPNEGEVGMKSHRLGVGGLAEIGYWAMLTRSRWQPEDLARALVWPPERVTAVLAELLVLRMLAEGLTDGAIARRLGKSVRTVRGTWLQP